MTALTTDKKRDCLLLAFAVELLRHLAEHQCGHGDWRVPLVRRLPGHVVEAGAWPDTGEPYLLCYANGAVLEWLEGVQDLAAPRVEEWLERRQLSAGSWERLCELLSEEDWVAPQEEEP